LRGEKTADLLTPAHLYDYLMIYVFKKKTTTFN